MRMLSVAGLLVYFILKINHKKIKKKNWFMSTAILWGCTFSDSIMFVFVQKNLLVIRILLFCYSSLMILPIIWWHVEKSFKCQGVIGRFAIPIAWKCLVLSLQFICCQDTTNLILLMGRCLSLQNCNSFVVQTQQI